MRWDKEKNFTFWKNFHILMKMSYPFIFFKYMNYRAFLVSFLLFCIKNKIYKTILVPLNNSQTVIQLWLYIYEERFFKTRQSTKSIRVIMQLPVLDHNEFQNIRQKPAYKDMIISLTEKYHEFWIKRFYLQKCEFYRRAIAMLWSTHYHPYWLCALSSFEKKTLLIFSIVVDFL